MQWICRTMTTFFRRHIVAEEPQAAQKISNNYMYI